MRKLSTTRSNTNRVLPRYELDDLREKIQWVHTRSKQVLKESIEKSEFRYKSEMWTYFVDAVENSPIRGELLIEMVEHCFRTYKTEMLEEVWADGEAAERAAMGETPKRVFEIGTQAAFVIGKEYGQWQILDYVGHLETFEECRDLALSRLSEISCRDGVSWAAVIPAEVVRGPDHCQRYVFSIKQRIDEMHPADFEIVTQTKIYSIDRPWVTRHPIDRLLYQPPGHICPLPEKDD